MKPMPSRAVTSVWASSQPWIPPATSSRSRILVKSGHLPRRTRPNSGRLFHEHVGPSLAETAGDKAAY